MEILPLGPVTEPIFWAHVNQDIPHYYHFAFDWKYMRDATKILLALEKDRIDGMMLIYRRMPPRMPVVQLRGSSVAVKNLLENLDLEKIEVLTENRHEKNVLKRYKPTVGHERMVMTLRRGEERLQIIHPIVELEASHAEQIANLMKNADPEYWGHTTGQQIAETMRNVDWLGIEVNGELVSVGSIILTKWTGLVGIVATSEAHRGIGYATSIVSKAVKHILEKLSISIIYVRTENLPAIRVYKKIGFKPYQTYFFMKGKRRL